jgi:putative membrane protein
MAIEPVPSDARRAHWLAILFGLWPAARGVLPFALLFFLGIGERRSIALHGWTNAVPALMTAWIAVLMCGRYWSDRYWCTPRELVHRSGLLHREERRIPIAQIQELAVQQSLLQRALGLATVTIQTGSGPGIPEIKLEHLARPALEELRQELRRPGPEPAVAGDPQTGGDLLLQLTTRDLVRLGLIENRGFAVLACA